MFALHRRRYFMPCYIRLLKLLPWYDIVQNHLESDVDKCRQHFSFVTDVFMQLHVLFCNTRWFRYRRRSVLNSSQINLDKGTGKYSHPPLYEYNYSWKPYVNVEIRHGWLMTIAISYGCNQLSRALWHLTFKCHIRNTHSSCRRELLSDNESSLVDIKKIINKITVTNRATSVTDSGLKASVYAHS